ncbi:hypothetical protein [Chryseobacterium balustinum]|uniref:hypothetical protein n=1 Tax=Chryseobacterium balustinum TaxID=246 RepID=UPI003CFA91D9
MIIRIFGVIILLLGGFLAYGIISRSLPIVFGTKIKATINTVEQVKSKRFTYVYYPVIEFTYKNKLRKITDKSSDVDKNTTNVQLYIYYSEKYGISRGFSTIEVVFSVISLAFIFFGIIALFKSK